MEALDRIKNRMKQAGKPGKNQFLILILAGVLLLVIALPVSPKSEKGDSESVVLDSGSDIIGNDTPAMLSEEAASGSDLPEYGEPADSASYTALMESRLEEVLGNIDGAGEVKVMLTLETSEEAVVEKDRPSSRSETEEEDAEGGRRTVSGEELGEDTIYISSKDGSGIPYVIKTLPPRIGGVVVVAQGGGNGQVKKNITEAIEALFGIEAHKIKVVKMKP